MVISNSLSTERASPTDKQDLLSELEVMKTLQPHPNVVRFKGCLSKGKVMCKGKQFSKCRLKVVRIARIKKTIYIDQTSLSSVELRRCMKLMNGFGS